MGGDLTLRRPFINTKVYLLEIIVGLDIFTLLNPKIAGIAINYSVIFPDQLCCLGYIVLIRDH